MTPMNGIHMIPQIFGFTPEMSKSTALAAVATTTPVLSVVYNNFSERLTSKSSHFVCDDGNDDEDGDDVDEEEKEGSFSFASGSTGSSKVKASNLSEHAIAVSVCRASHCW